NDLRVGLTLRSMARLPFLRPNLVPLEMYERYLRSMEDRRWYSNFGPLNEAFERRLVEECFDGRGALSTVNNATTGLILAIALLKRAGGRYALMPSFTFAATPLAATWAGLTPYFVDVDSRGFSMDPEALRSALRA